ncbi:phage tail sheath protein [Desulfurivibrio sp. D14AmB]|uniref:phage tail sheath protein n=1 Tax=Desulfurivibrio sp. D14AmB TaxID=3374370 RepID=UPI00376EB4EA
MKGLRFEVLTSSAPAAANRADLACFIGLVKVRDAEPPADLRQWLQQEGWWPTATAAGARGGAPSLYQVPVPVASWERFDQLFAWDQRPYDEATLGATYLGAAVRSFFAQGGRKCYVVSCGEPLAYGASRPERDAALRQLVPLAMGQAGQRGSWYGLHHLFGLPGVSFVILPDLAELACSLREENPPPSELPPPLPEFTNCSEPGPLPARERRVMRLPLPVCDDQDYHRWRAVVHRATRWLADHRREMQLLAALPVPHRESAAAVGLLPFLHRQGWLSGALAAGDCPAGAEGLDELAREACSIASAFLQLGYPWLKTAYAGDLPAALEPPEGVLAGLLARNALTRGTFRSAIPLPLQELVGVFPRLDQAQLHGLNPQAPWRASPQAALNDRVSLFGPTPEGLRLLSDVTTSNEPTYRQAAINRTIGLVMRAARAVGEEYVFDSSGEHLWRQVGSRLSDVLRAMQDAGALAAGGGDREAFLVRCDRSTMSQQDIDSGRVVAQVTIRPVAAIETMRIQLAMGDGGRISLSSLGVEAA